MKPNRYLVPIGLLLFAVLSLVPSEAQINPGPSSQTVTTSGTAMQPFANALTQPGAMTATFEEKISGAPATVSILIQGCMRGQTCDTLDTYTTVANSNRKPTITSVYDYFLVTPSWTGGTNVSVSVNYSQAQGAAAGSASIGSVTITSPSDGSGNVKVNCVSGCGGTSDPCSSLTRSSAIINLTASGQIITGSASTQTYICFLQFSLGSSADNVALVEGTGSVCAVGTAGMAGGSTAGTGWNLLANASVTAGGITSWAFKTATTADNVCLLASSSTQITGTVQYVHQ